MRIASTTHFLSAPTRHGHATGRDLPSAPVGRQAQMTQLRYYPKAQSRQGADRDRTPHVDHLSPQTRIASIIVTAHAAPKITTNNRSPCDNARPQPNAASTASATSSRK